MGDRHTKVPHRAHPAKLATKTRRNNLPRLGFLVNPVAGMGGPVGLKGTDGKATLREALKRGAKPVSPVRGREFLTRIKPRADELELLVAPGIMGGDIAKSVTVGHRVVGRVGRDTSAEDTVRISRQMKSRKVDLLVFCGGDGTARDIMKGVGDETSVLGIPAGVKVYSSVFAITPQAAAASTLQFLEKRIQKKHGEVLDIDENEYRRGGLSVRLVGRLTTPDAGSLLQESKSPSHLSERAALEGIAEELKEQWDPDGVYVLGPGTTVEVICQQWGVKKTLLGVDVIKGDGTVLGKDVNEDQLLGLVEEGSTKVIVSPIGGQGFLFGRGNQQISPRVLKKIGSDNVIVVSARNKIDSLIPKRLLVDTGDRAVDRQLRGYRRVITDFREEMVVKVE